ncbi:uncharacterized protein LOC127600843 isoform X2 [Hippocampus zosterae]|uniref:uncharacterized protein LOC127600843 isoform X2 n=1 Tax=Hippocampus zosterae TaxID=109293 RepID=UPI00223E4290|nr:uncharacterized protein LOC127600843 isoform X2 [Hippocampus zosterae]
MVGRFDAAMSYSSLAWGGQRRTMRRMAACGVRLKRSSNVSLHKRFSQVPAGQPMGPQMATVPESVLLWTASSSSINPQVGPACFSLVPMAPPPPRRRSVWTRLGWRRVGFWSSRNKYGWRGRSRATLTRAKGTGSPAVRCLITLGSFRKAARGRTPASGIYHRRESFNFKAPTKKRLDAQLDNYMSKSKKRLDAQLDDYMAKSKKRLDADLDEYMAQGRRPLSWFE